VLFLSWPLVLLFLGPLSGFVFELFRLRSTPFFVCTLFDFRFSLATLIIVASACVDLCHLPF
jgi:hypothetical protein